MTTGHDNGISCPYDKCGQFLDRQRLEDHLATHRVELDNALRKRVKKPEEELNFCPYNSRHIVPKVELEAHIATCPSKRRYLMIQSLLNSSSVALEETDVRPDPPPNSFGTRAASTNLTTDKRHRSCDSGRGDSVSSTPRSLQSLTPTSISSAVSISLDSGDDSLIQDDCVGSNKTAASVASVAPVDVVDPVAPPAAPPNKFLRARNGPMTRRKKAPV